MAKVPLNVLIDDDLLFVMKLVSHEHGASMASVTSMLLTAFVKSDPSYPLYHACWHDNEYRRLYRRGICGVKLSRSDAKRFRAIIFMMSKNGIEINEDNFVEFAEDE